MNIETCSTCDGTGLISPTPNADPNGCPQCFGRGVVEADAR